MPTEPYHSIYSPDAPFVNPAITAKLDLTSPFLGASIICRREQSLLVTQRNRRDDAIQHASGPRIADIGIYLFETGTYRRQAWAPTNRFVSTPRLAKKSCEPLCLVFLPLLPVRNLGKSSMPENSAQSTLWPIKCAAFLHHPLPARCNQSRTMASSSALRRKNVVPFLRLFHEFE